jgi:hypothetical protein
MKKDTSVFDHMADVLEALDAARNEAERKIYVRTALRGLSRALETTKQWADAIRKGVR